MKHTSNALRTIQRDESSRWNYSSPAQGFIHSFDRREDAIARAVTALKQKGGGAWRVLNEVGQVLDQGTVCSSR